jgi:ferric-dicitrate binding protein FerR (iron transport regulator)
MRCFATEAELVSMLDGRLDAAHELAVHAHLESCADCRRRAAIWGRLAPVMRRLAPEPPGPLRARRMEVEIERQLAQLPAPRRAPGPAVAWAGLAVAAAAAGIVLVARLRGGEARLPETTSRLTAQVTSIAGAARTGAGALRAGAAIAADQPIDVEAGGVATLALADASVTIEGPARLTVAGDVGHVALGLDRGTLTASVAHRAPGATFAVTTHEARVEIRGTRFIVEASAVRSTVAVQEGRVAVFAGDGSERSVAAGERVALEGTRFVDERPAPAVEAPPSVEAAPRPCEPSGPSCEVTARQARASMRAGDAARALRLVESAMAARLDCSDASAGTSSCHDELRYLRAEALRQDGRFDAAVTAYKALDHRAAPAAMRQNAFYAAAQLEQRLGRLTAARADFERALAAAPAGALREEALMGAMDSAAAAGETGHAAELAARYLEDFPAGLGAARARALTPSRPPAR